MQPVRSQPPVRARRGLGPLRFCDRPSPAPDDRHLEDLRRRRRAYAASISRCDAGEMHGLVGENGAGKSTLMKIIAGVHTGYDGEHAARRRRRCTSARPRDALAAGIGMVHQELSIVPDLERRRERVPGRAAGERGSASSTGARMAQRGRASSSSSLGIDVDPGARIGTLPIGLQQLVELGARAVLRRAHHHPRRADLRAVAARDRAAVRRAAPAAGRRAQHHLHLALPRRRARDLRPGHRLPQRPQGRDRPMHAARSTRTGSSSA